MNCIEKDQNIVIIPTLNAADTLVEQLTLLVKMSDVLVIDSESEDNTVEIANSFGVDVIQIKRSDFNHATTRNLALNHKADFYLFMTQDALPYDENLIKNLLKPFEDEDIVVSYARQIPHEDADEIEKFARNTNYPKNSLIKSKESLSTLGIKTFFCSNTCAMYRASYFKEVGGFSEGLIMNEDMEYAARAILDRKKVAYMANAKVWHSHDYDLKDIFKRYFDIGVFFKTNSWILDEVSRYASASSTGIDQAKKELIFLLQNAPLSIPRSIIFSFTKFFAYKLGFYHKVLPLKIKKIFSLHKNFHS